MAIAFIDSVSAGPGSAGGATGAIDTTGATLLVASIGRFSAGTFSDSEGNTWTQLNNGGVNITVQEYYYCLNPSTNASHTFTYSGASTFPGITVAAYSGDLTYDQVSSGTDTSSTTGDPNAITAGEDVALYVLGQSHSDTTGQSVDSSFNEREDLANSGGVNFGQYLADKIVASAASNNPIVTGGTAVDRVSVMATFVEAPVAGIFPSSIASSLSFGSPTVTVDTEVITATGIASAEAFGDATVTLSELNLAPSGIASAEAFGNPSLAGVTVLTVTGIASAESFGGATVALSDLSVAPSGIASAESFGNPSLGITRIIEPTGIASSESFGTHIIGGQVVETTGIVSAEAFGLPTVLTDVTKNYYGSIAGANEFFAARLNRFDWTNATYDDQVKALKHASKLIDRFNYIDQKYTVRVWLEANPDADLTTDANQAALRAADLDQNNEFPRGLSNIVPDAIEKATYLIAKALLSGRDPDADLESLAVVQSQYGSLKTTYQREGNNQQHLTHLIPSPQAFNLIRPFFRERDLFKVERVS